VRKGSRLCDRSGAALPRSGDTGPLHATLRPPLPYIGITPAKHVRRVASNGRCPNQTASICFTRDKILKKMRETVRSLYYFRRSVTTSCHSDFSFYSHSPGIGQHFSSLRPQKNVASRTINRHAQKTFRVSLLQKYGINGDKVGGIVFTLGDRRNPTFVGMTQGGGAAESLSRKSGKR